MQVLAERKKAESSTRSVENVAQRDTNITHVTLDMDTVTDTVADVTSMSTHLTDTTVASLMDTTSITSTMDTTIITDVDANFCVLNGFVKMKQQ